MTVVERVRELVAPLASEASLDVYDVEHSPGRIRVLVDAAGGVDMARIARLSRAVSRALDAHDLMPGRYTLEVSSPGLERPLRAPDHFRAAVGSDVKVKTVADYDGPRRLSGVLTAVDASGVELRGESGSRHRVNYGEIVWARTVFDWGPASRSRRPNPKRHGGGPPGAAGRRAPKRHDLRQPDSPTQVSTN